MLCPFHVPHACMATLWAFTSVHHPYLEAAEPSQGMRGREAQAAVHAEAAQPCQLAQGRGQGWRRAWRPLGLQQRLPAAGRQPHIQWGASSDSQGGEEGCPAAQLGDLGAGILQEVVQRVLMSCVCVYVMG